MNSQVTINVSDNQLNDFCKDYNPHEKEERRTLQILLWKRIHHVHRFNNLQVIRFCWRSNGHETFNYKDCGREIMIESHMIESNGNIELLNNYNNGLPNIWLEKE